MTGNHYRPSATPMPDPNENPTDHGDFDREPWFNVIGPQHAGNVPLPPTDEVRPTDMIENGLTEEKMRWYDLVTVSGFEHVHTICKTHRRRNRGGPHLFLIMTKFASLNLIK